MYQEVTKNTIDEVKRIISLKNSLLGTTDEDGYPLITKAVPMLFNNEVYLCLSELSQHSKNIIQNTKIAVYFGGEVTHKATLNNKRLSITGDIVQVEKTQELIDEYIKLEKSSKSYIYFGDFHMYKLDIKKIHFIEGFGKAYIINKEMLK